MGRHKKAAKVEYVNIRVHKKDRDEFMQWLADTYQEHVKITDIFHEVVTALKNGLMNCKPGSEYCKFRLEQHNAEEKQGK